MATTPTKTTIVVYQGKPFMFKIRKALITAVAGLMLVLGVAFAVPATASAQQLPPQETAGAMGNCTLPGLCGRFYNYGGVGVGLIKDWGTTASYTAVLRPGQRSWWSVSSGGLGWPDTDGFYVSGRDSGGCYEVTISYALVGGGTGYNIYRGGLYGRQFKLTDAWQAYGINQYHGYC